MEIEPVNCNLVTNLFVRDYKKETLILLALLFCNFFAINIKFIYLFFFRDLFDFSWPMHSISSF